MKTSIGRILTVIAGISLLVAVPALAHHSFAAAYDETKPDWGPSALLVVTPERVYGHESE